MVPESYPGPQANLALHTGPICACLRTKIIIPYSLLGKRNRCPEWPRWATARAGPASGEGHRNPQAQTGQDATGSCTMGRPDQGPVPGVPHQ